MNRLAILMTSYNRAQTTLACLRRIFSQQLPLGCGVDVWLVDDASPDGTGTKVMEEFPHVRVIKGAGNLFWCKGMRLAWDMASKAYDYDYYVWLNDDTILIDDALLTVMKDYEQIRDVHPLSVIAGSFTDGLNSSVISYGCTTAGGCRIVPDGTVQLATGDMAGNFVLVPKIVYKTIGPLYGNYSHAFGDYDYALTLREKGGGVYSSSRVLGWCKTNLGKDLSSCSFLQRLRLLALPNGYNLHDTFIFRLRHWGVLRAFVSSFHVILTVAIGRRRLFR